MSATTEQSSVELHLHRGYGAMYLGVGAILGCLVLAGFADYLGEAKLVQAGVTLVVGLAVTAFLIKIGLDLVVPVIRADADGISGRLSLRGGPFAGEWSEVDIDVAYDTSSTARADDRPLPGRFELGIDEQSVVLFSRSWFGFRDFVLLVATTARASRRLSPDAEAEMSRLLGIEQIPPAEEFPSD